jgi:hypothetical protein
MRGQSGVEQGAERDMNELARRLGTSESKTLRMVLMDYAKELSLMKESIRRGKSQI